MADKVHKQEPRAQHKCQYVLHNHPYISSSQGMADATLFYCYLCKDSCVKPRVYTLGETYSHLRCGSCLCTLSASNTSTPCIWNLLASSFIPLPLPSLHFKKKYTYPVCWALSTECAVLCHCKHCHCWFFLHFDCASQWWEWQHVHDTWCCQKPNLLNRNAEQQLHGTQLTNHYAPFLLQAHIHMSAYTSNVHLPCMHVLPIWILTNSQLSYRGVLPCDMGLIIFMHMHLMLYTSKTILLNKNPISCRWKSICYWALHYTLIVMHFWLYIYIVGTHKDSNHAVKCYF